MDLFNYRRRVGMTAGMTVALALSLFGILVARTANAYSASSPTTVACPPLHCDVTQRGVLWNHPNRGNLNDVELTGPVRTSAKCSEICASTPGCDVWLFGLVSTGSYCKMWTAEQSPCRPGAFGDVMYDPTPRIEGFFGFGGNCNSRKTVKIAIADDSATASATPSRATASPTQGGLLGGESSANGGEILDVNVAVGVTAEAPVQGSDPRSLEISPAMAGGLSVQSGEEGEPQLVEAAVAVRLRGQKQSDLAVPGFVVAGTDGSTEPVNARGPRNAGGENGSAAVSAQAAPDRAVRGADGGVALTASAAGVAGVADALERQQGPTAQCPDFRCNWPRTGFFFDRPEKGHQAVMVTPYTNQPFECWRICRRTEHCAFWMFEMQAIQGRCKLWRKEQSPCEPADPADVTSTTYQQRADGLFVVGGNCEGGIETIAKTTAS